MSHRPELIASVSDSDPVVALPGEERLVCAGAGEASAAVAAGVPRDRILVRATPGDVEPLVAAGWATIVDVDRPGPSSAAVAVALAAVCAWRGASVIRTRHVREVRRGLDMTESIAGLRPPAWAVRGLA